MVTSVWITELHGHLLLQVLQSIKVPAGIHPVLGPADLQQLGGVGSHHSNGIEDHSLGPQGLGGLFHLVLGLTVCYHHQPLLQVRTASTLTVKLLRDPSDGFTRVGAPTNLLHLINGFGQLLLGVVLVEAELQSLDGAVLHHTNMDLILANVGLFNDRLHEVFHFLVVPRPNAPRAVNQENKVSWDAFADCKEMDTSALPFVFRT